MCFFFTKNLNLKKMNYYFFCLFVFCCFFCVCVWGGGGLEYFLQGIQIQKKMCFCGGWGVVD